MELFTKRSYTSVGQPVMIKGDFDIKSSARSILISFFLNVEGEYFFSVPLLKNSSYWIKFLMFGEGWRHKTQCCTFPLPRDLLLDFHKSVWQAIDK